MRVGGKVHRLNSSYDDIIYVFDYFFDQWYPSIATPIEDVCGLQGRLSQKNEEYLGQPMNFSADPEFHNEKNENVEINSLMR